MLKFLKGVLAVAGLLLIIVAVVLAVRNIWDLREIVGVANANTSTVRYDAGQVRSQVLIIGGGALLGGLLLGLGIGLPRQTFKQQYQARQQAASAQAAQPSDADQRAGKGPASENNQAGTN